MQHKEGTPCGVVPVGARGAFDCTALHKAAVIGHLSVVRYLCEQGADMGARDDSDCTPLHDERDRTQ